VGAWWRLELLPEVPEALRLLRKAGYRLVCVTNQSGVARGLYRRRSLERVLVRLATLLEEAGTPLDAIYACPHHPRYGPRCLCRKPGTRMLRLAARDLGLDLRRSVSIGDQWRDAAAGRRAGGRGILIDRRARQGGRKDAADAVVRDLLEAARLLVREGLSRARRTGS
jgi:histidinol-phosphate phosphatase family protein